MVRAAERGIEGTHAEHVSALQQGLVALRAANDRSAGAVATRLERLAQRGAALDNVLALLG